jgi:CheY-like chemotaxis protein
MHKLLLADDSVTIQRVIELTFSGEDIQVVAVNDGEQAIARIPAERPDIVLADIGMPKKGGYDVAAFVKGRSDLEHIPVLLLAGAFEPVDQARAEQVRCDGVLIKPFEPRQVIERVRELLEGVKGSPAKATADVPRPVERLSPRPDMPPVPVPTPIAAASAPPAPSPSPVALAAPVEEPSPVSDTDSALDEYFESLNAAFESVGPAIPPTSHGEAPDSPRFEASARSENGSPRSASGSLDAPRRRGDSLDEYFDRLSTAFEHAKTADAPHALPDGFDELIEERRVPTVEALVGGSKPSENGASNGNGTAPVVNGHERARNPIVEALEAMLGHPEALPTQQTLPGLPDGHVNGHANGHDLELVGTDLVDTVTERVLERLVPEITATVQRLVEEEVDRLRH